MASESRLTSGSFRIRQERRVTADPRYLPEPDIPRDTFGHQWGGNQFDRAHCQPADSGSVGTVESQGCTLYPPGPLAASGHGVAVCVCLRGGGGAVGHSALAAGVDRQQSAADLSFLADNCIEWVFSRNLQRPGDPGYLDWILGSDSLPGRGTTLKNPRIYGRDGRR